MTILGWIMLASCVITLIALAVTLSNLRRYRQSSDKPERDASITVCIPARNEERNIDACLRGVLANDHANIKVLVYNDHSSDQTESIVRSWMARDPRVKLASVTALPPGWNGKQFACDRMGREADTDWLLFTDADVRFESDCLRRTLASAQQRRCHLVSTFPLQRTGTMAEVINIPMIHFLLFSYLPMGRMQRTLDPAASAGCGQFLFAERDAYLTAGGHAAFPNSMHDGIMMPRAFRRHGFRTDLFDGTDLTSCRMYDGWGQTWRGFAKNAYEGLGSIWLLLLLTILHLVGHVMPWCVLGVLAIGALVGTDAVTHHWPTLLLAFIAIGIAITQRTILARRFRQDWRTILFHPVGVLTMTAIQWHSFYLTITGRRSWRGRTANNEVIASSRS